MRDRRLIVLVAGALLGSAGPALGDREIAGFRIPAAVEAGGSRLQLNGAHVRRSFLRDVTLFALYTREPVRSFEALLAARTPARVAVTILREEFTAERFRAGWREQFEQALSVPQRAALAGEIEQFIGAFVTLRRGEQIQFDFVPGAGVRMQARGEPRAEIAGEAFAAALLGVWVGPRSVDPELREALLAGS